MQKWRTVWIFAAITPLLFILAFVTFIGSVEIGRIQGEPDGAVALLGFLAALVITMLSVACGMFAIVLWWNRKA